MLFRSKVDVYNMEGAVTGQVELSDAIFGLEQPNEAVMHQVVKAILANRRQGTAATKTRSFVRGGTFYKILSGAMGLYAAVYRAGRWRRSSTGCYGLVVGKPAAGFV